VGWRRAGRAICRRVKEKDQLFKEGVLTRGAIYRRRAQLARESLGEKEGGAKKSSLEESRDGGRLLKEARWPLAAPRGAFRN